MRLIFIWLSSASLTSCKTAKDHSDIEAAKAGPINIQMLDAGSVAEKRLKGSPGCQFYVDSRGSTIGISVPGHAVVELKVPLNGVGISKGKPKKQDNEHTIYTWTIANAGTLTLFEGNDSYKATIVLQSGMQGSCSIDS